MKRELPSIALILCTVMLITVSGCTTFTLEGGDTGSNTVTTRTEVIFLYGLAGQPDMKNLCGKNLPVGIQANKALSTVKVKSNFLYMLCATVTLGLIQPMDFEYTCAVPCVIEH